ncbi:hypothetical protein BHM03_00041790 [Ensete ventricosum]|uniref:Uncharacterized protein n=1 Tax=Ensete ventricosum TaxID=4639 RepID=A0A445MKC0_ENSVE|nr:hypothetical protein BHM03_00041790 [Ensete ventricosum]
MISVEIELVRCSRTKTHHVLWRYSDVYIWDLHSHTNTKAGKKEGTLNLVPAYPMRCHVEPYRGLSQLHVLQQRPAFGFARGSSALCRTMIDGDGASLKAVWCSAT